MTKVVPESDWGEEAYEPMPAATSGGFVPLQMLGAPQPAHKKATMENPAGGGCGSGTCGC